MAKELGNPQGTPDVFQMFNENRTYYFESDISALPHLPCPAPAPVTPQEVPKLQKSFSQPCLHRPSTESPPVQSASRRPVANLHIPAAIMATTTTTHPTPHPAPWAGDGTGTDQSLETRYRTEPSYGSSKILKSFNHEFRLFSSHVKREVVSAPTSPRRSSSPELDLECLQPRMDSDPRKLSLVMEEADKDFKYETQRLAAQHISEVKEVRREKTAAKPLLSAVPKDSVDGENMARGTKRSLTKQVMTWFVTSQTPTRTHSKTSKTEFNAMNPSSF